MIIYCKHCYNSSKFYYFCRKKISKYGVLIPKSTNIDENIFFPHPISIVIGKNVKIGKNCTIYQNVTIGQKEDNYPVLGNNIIIYPNSIIIGKIKIGDNVIIGAGSVVLCDIPSNSIVAGNPARIIKMINNK